MAFMLLYSVAMYLIWSDQFFVYFVSERVLVNLKRIGFTSEAL